VPIIVILYKDIIQEEFLPCDLNEGITTRLSLAYNLFPRKGFYLVTWMKGLRLAFFMIATSWNDISFYLVTWMKGLRREVIDIRCLPELQAFLPCDLNEGITTPLFGDLHTPQNKRFYLVTWMKGLRPVLCPAFWHYWKAQFLPCDLNEGITTNTIT